MFLAVEIVSIAGKFALSRSSVGHRLSPPFSSEIRVANEEFVETDGQQRQIAGLGVWLPRHARQTLRGLAVHRTFLRPLLRGR